MSELAPQAEFRDASTAPLGLSGAISRARDEIGVLTQLPIDAVTRSERSADGGWIIALDLLESAARLGDNDLLSTYEIELDDTGDVIRMERTGRYKREDGA